MLSLVEKGEEPEIRHYLEMLGHHEWTEEGVIISDVLEKKGRLVIQRFVIFDIWWLKLVAQSSG